MLRQFLWATVAIGVLLPLPSHAQIPPLQITLQAQTTAVNAIAFTPDGDVLISGGGHNDGRLRFWRTATGRMLRTIRSQRMGISAIALSPDGEHLASTGEDGEIHFWSLTDGEFKHTLRDHRGNVLDLAITPDNQVLISAGLDGVKVWDLQRYRPLYTLTEFQPVAHIALHPNGQILAGGTADGHVLLWNLRSGEALANLPAHEMAITALTFSRDGEMLITGSGDRTLKLWDLTTNRLETTLTGHTGPITALALTPDGETLMSSSHDGIRAWDLASGNLLTYWQGHQDWITTLAIFPDGQGIASGDLSGKIKLWQWPPELPPEPSGEFDEPT